MQLAAGAVCPASCVLQPHSQAQRHAGRSRQAVTAALPARQTPEPRRRRGSSLSPPPPRSLPEDGHHNPQETPEAWLLAQEHAAEEASQQQRQQAQLTLPYLGLTVTPELVAISAVYFVQGILGLSRLALSFFFKDDLGVEPAQVAVLTGLAGLPWVVKPLYGFISDSVPLFGYRRRSYLLLCGLAGSTSWLALAGLVHSPAAAVGAMLLGSLSTACSDVVVDSLVVERARGEPASTAGSLQSLCWASSAVGGVASAYFSGSLVETYGSQTVFALTAVFPLIVSASALLIDEQRVTARLPAAPSGADAATGAAASAAASAKALMPSHSVHQQQQQQQQQPQQQGLAALPSSSSSSNGGWRRALAQQLVSQGGALWGAVRQRHILLPTVFVFLWQATPSADTAVFYFYTNELHFQPEFLGRVRLVGSLASLAGVALYNGFFKTVPLRKMLLGAMLLGTALGSTQLLLVSGANRALGLSDELFVLGDSAILTVLGQVSFMPILVLAARLCPEGIEATLFATLMSILNGGSFVGSALGASLTAYLGVTSSDFSNLFVLLLLCNLSTLLPAPFLGLLPASLDQDPPAGGGGSGGGGGDNDRKENLKEGAAAAAAAAAAGGGRGAKRRGAEAAAPQAQASSGLLARAMLQAAAPPRPPSRASSCVPCANAGASDDAGAAAGGQRLQ